MSGAPILLTIGVVIAAAFIGGRIARRLHQPPVVGEILAVIAISPAVLGQLAPSASAWLQPRGSSDIVAALAQIGVSVFMLVVGLDLRFQRGRRRQVAAVAAGSLLLPFALGVAVATGLVGSRGSGVPVWAFVLYTGGSLAVTAVPVLALILRDRGMTNTPVGSASLTAATISDAFIWTLLAVVSVGTSRADVPIAVRVAGAAALVGGAVLLHLLLRMLVRRDILDRLHPPVSIAVALAAAAGSAVASNAVGLHAVIGPVLLGLAIPRDSGFARSLAQGLGDFARAALLPFFFLDIANHIEVSSLATPWLVLLLLAVAFVGKMGGALLGSRLTGADWEEAVQLAILLSARGLTELVFLQAGLELGIIRPPLYTALVAVTLVTTVATGPLLSLFERVRRRRSRPRSPDGSAPPVNVDQPDTAETPRSVPWPPTTP